MRTVVHHNPVTRMVDIWIFQEYGVGGSVYRSGPDGDFWEPVADREEPEPSFSIPVLIFASIVEEGMGVVPASSTMEKAWNDSIAVRDRLLTIVERLTP